MSKGSPNPSGFSALSQFPGIAETGLTWPTFHAYVEWLVGMLRSYLATIVQRLGPRLVHVGFAVTTDAWEALRRHGDPAVLPAENREPLPRRSRIPTNRSTTPTTSNARAFRC